MVCRHNVETMLPSITASERRLNKESLQRSMDTHHKPCETTGDDYTKNVNQSFKCKIHVMRPGVSKLRRLFATFFDWRDSSSTK